MLKRLIAISSSFLILFCCVGLSACSNPKSSSRSGKSSARKSPVSQGLEFEKDSHNPYYVVAGIGVCTDTTVYIPSEYNGLPVKEIKSNAFSKCTSFTKIVVPGSIEKIGRYAFNKCSSMTDIELNEGLTTISEGAFSGCGISEIHLPSTVVSIEDSAFANCSSLKSFNIPSGISNIPDYCFAGCTSLETVYIPEGVTTIGGAFQLCFALKDVTLPNSLTTLNVTFADCTSLRSITIPKNVTMIHALTSSGCSELTIHCYADINLSYLEDCDGSIIYH